MLSHILSLPFSFPFYETGPHCEALAGLELAEISTCLLLPSDAGVKGMSYHAWLPSFSLPCLLPVPELPTLPLFFFSVLWSHLLRRAYQNLHLFSVYVFETKFGHKIQAGLEFYPPASHFLLSPCRAEPTSHSSSNRDIAECLASYVFYHYTFVYFVSHKCCWHFPKNKMDLRMFLIIYCIGGLLCPLLSCVFQILYLWISSGAVNEEKAKQEVSLVTN